MRGGQRVALAGRVVGAALTVLALVGPAMADSQPVNVGSGVQVHAAVRSLKALRDHNVVRQAQDYSCGAAALATLISFGLGEPVTERELLDELFLDLSSDQAQVRQREGFSLLDMQRVAHQRGYKAQGFRIRPRDLKRLSGPVIVFIQPDGYEHFAVLRGVRADRVFLADPSAGNVRMPAYRFLRSWMDEDGTGVIFVVEPRDGRHPASTSVLALPGAASSQPELLGARELLAVGAGARPAVRPPSTAR